MLTVELSGGDAAAVASAARGAVPTPTPTFPGYHPQVLLCNQREAAAIAGVQYAGRRPMRLSSPNPTTLTP